jgi:hypothetical protein
VGGPPVAHIVRMTSRVTACLVVALAVAAVACGDDTGPTAGRFEDESVEGEGPPPAAADPKAASTQDPAAPKDGQPSPAAPGDTNPPAPPTDPAVARACSTARDLGTLSGDTGSAQIVANGNCNDWVKIRVTEDYNYPLPQAMRVTATLLSPNPDDFDLFAFVNEASDVRECSTVTGKSELPASRSDVVKLSWGEAYITNTSDDARTVSFEVRKKTPGCSMGQWSLVLQGNY